MEDALFPFLADGTEAGQAISELPLFREYAWDESGVQLEAGKTPIVEGLPALEIWIRKALKTLRYAFAAYSWDYGCELESLIGQPYTPAVTRSEAERMVREALLVSPYIEAVDVTNAEMIGDALQIECTVRTVYGEVEMIV